MNYILPRFVQELNSLNGFKGIYSLELVRDRLSRYDKVLTTELPRSRDKNIQIIGMSHMHRDAPRCVHEEIIDSQQTVISLLEKLQPNIVGIEGFGGEKFSVPAAIIERDKLLGRAVIRINERVKLVRDDPRMNPLLIYQEQNPQISFVGIDQPEISVASEEINRIFALGSIPKYSKQKLQTLTNNLSTLRGLLMVAKISRAMKNLNRDRACLPVGFGHLDEIITLKKLLGADWTIYDARYKTVATIEE